MQSFVDTAILEAQKSSMEHRHGCVIVYKNKILLSTHNYRVYFFSHGFSVHAEVEAIRRLRNLNVDPKECTMIIVRLGYSDDSTTKFSKPCNDCQKEIEKAKFKKVYYST